MSRHFVFFTHLSKSSSSSWNITSNELKLFYFTFMFVLEPLNLWTEQVRTLRWVFICVLLVELYKLYIFFLLQYYKPHKPRSKKLNSLFFWFVFFIWFRLCVPSWHYTLRVKAEQLLYSIVIWLLLAFLLYFCYL